MIRNNNHRNIANDDDNKELLKFEQLVIRHVTQFGFEKVNQHYCQATVDQHEAGFMDQLQVKKGSYQADGMGFTGDHISLWEGANGTVFRCDEYAMSWDQLLARIQKYKDLGFDGYVSGQSIHYPGVTFGIVAFEKGQYSINPGI